MMISVSRREKLRVSLRWSWCHVTMISTSGRDGFRCHVVMVPGVLLRLSRRHIAMISMSRREDLVFTSRWSPCHVTIRWSPVSRRDDLRCLAAKNSLARHDDLHITSRWSPVVTMNSVSHCDGLGVTSR